MKRLAVVGHPVAHSRSPAMQTAAFEAVGLGGEWAYEAIDVEPEGLAGLIGAMPSEGFVGANVTIPHKLAALDLADVATRRAREIGATNTLCFGEDGVEADNTDAPGMMAALGEVSGRALVIGAGGSARAAIWALGDAGLEVSVWNRTPERAEVVAGEFGALQAEAQPRLGRFDVIVNATPVGLGATGPPEPRAPGIETPGEPSVSARGEPAVSGTRETVVSDTAEALKGFPITADGLTDRQVVVDLAYGSVETPVIAAARAAGARWIDGLEVLVRQGAESFRIWTGIDPPLDEMRRAARAERADNGRAPDTSLSGPRPRG